MIEELRKFIIEEYISKNREIDAEFYVGIVNIYSKYNGIEGWISKIKFEEINPEECTEGEYRPSKHEIAFDYMFIDDTAGDIAALLGSKLNEEEQVWIQYLHTARVILHELAHVKQRKNCIAKSIDDIKDNRERVVTEVNPYFRSNIEYSSELFGEEEALLKIKEWSDELEERYGYDVVMERDAEIESAIIINSILKDYQDKVPSVAKFFNACLYSSIEMGYEYVNDRVVSPIHKRAEIMKKKNFINGNIKWYDADLDKSLAESINAVPSAAERLRCGLPVTPEEYLKFKRKLCEFNRDGYVVMVYREEDKEENIEQKDQID